MEMWEYNCLSLAVEKVEIPQSLMLSLSLPVNEAEWYELDSLYVDGLMVDSEVKVCVGVFISLW